MAAFERTGFQDQLTIETPEQVELSFDAAGIGSRFLAILLDQLLIGLAYIVLGVVFVGLFAGFGSSSRFDTLSMWFVAALLLLVFLMTWGYFALFEAFWHGQTPGKRVLKLRVIKDSGRQVTLFEALARNLLRFVDYLPSLYLVGVITMLCNRRSKRLGDLVAGTIVVHERTHEQPLLFNQSVSAFTPQANSAAPWRDPVPAMFPADAVARLAPQDLIVIETFFNRMLDLTLETRADLARRIAAQMSAKMGVPIPGDTNPERALEAMAFQMRSRR